MNRHELFQEAWTGLRAEGDPQPVLDDLELRWSEPHRRYHTLAHLDACLEELARVREALERPEQVLFAAFAHDVIYDPHHDDNESRSVEWALQVLEGAGIPPEVRERVAWLILATRHDGIPADSDIQHLLDADLAILGQDRERFAAYERQVREEFQHVPGMVYRTARVRLLQGLLQRPALFLTETFRERYEETARANLQHSLQRLNSLRGQLGL